MQRNIRIDSLPSNRRSASKDCRCCVERRIRCDRSLPTCLKCKSRELRCPGFGPVNVRWNRGIASRGKFSGKRKPVLDDPANNSRLTAPQRSSRYKTYGSSILTLPLHFSAASSATFRLKSSPV
ncbi:hypothetical protein HYQ44_016386 [Verticillium longisporum]|nr:hypothetical protein HYQ44_016386 [Verticillium longisporum]